MPIDKNSQLGGFDAPPRKDSFAARVARSENPNATVDSSEMSESERALMKKASEIDKAAASFSFTKPELADERVEIIFDNSGSMAGQAITDAKEGVTEFMKACTPNQTAIRVVPVDSQGDNALQVYLRSSRSCDASLSRVFDASGGTPL